MYLDRARDVLVKMQHEEHYEVSIVLLTTLLAREFGSWRDGYVDADADADADTDAGGDGDEAVVRSACSLARPPKVE